MPLWERPRPRESIVITQRGARASVASAVAISWKSEPLRERPGRHTIGKLRSRRFGSAGMYLVKKADLEEWLESRGLPVYQKD